MSRATTAFLRRGARTVALAALAAVASPTSVAAAASDSCPASGVRVFLKSSGSLILNGRSIEASRLSSELSAIRPRPTLICYSREKPWDKPPATVELVLGALMALNLPFRFYTDATFSSPAPVEMDAAL